jgi:hypothetical protein
MVDVMHGRYLMGRKLSVGCQSRAVPAEHANPIRQAGTGEDQVTGSAGELVHRGRIRFGDRFRRLPVGDLLDQPDEGRIALLFANEVVGSPILELFEALDALIAFLPVAFGNHPDHPSSAPSHLPAEDGWVGRPIPAGTNGGERPT